MPTDDERNKAVLRRLIKVHHGQVSAIATALLQRGEPISHQAVSERLEKHGLREEAAAARRAAGIPGRRTPLSKDELREEREHIIATLAAAPSDRQGVKALGMSRTQLFRKLVQHDIPQELIAARRAKHARKAPA